MRRVFLSQGREAHFCPEVKSSRQWPPKTGTSGKEANAESGQQGGVGLGHTRKTEPPKRHPGRYSAHQSKKQLEFAPPCTQTTAEQTRLRSPHTQAHAGPTNRPPSFMSPPSRAAVPFPCPRFPALS